MSEGRDARWAGTIPAAYSAVLTALVAGPLLGPGYLLLRDAVSTPRSYPTDSALGLGDAAPRAVPQDALLALLTPVVDGGVLVKAILLVALWAAGYGAALSARELLRVPIGPQLVAATVAIWNPYVAERLLQGHWSLLTGYAALPWTVLAARRLRACVEPGTARSPIAPPPVERPRPTTASADLVAAEIDPTVGTPDDPARSTAVRSRWAMVARLRPTPAVGAWGTLVACLAAAGLTPTGALLAGCVALVTVGRRRLPATLLLIVAVSAPWTVATALSGAGAEPSDPTGITAFAARAEPWLGTFGSLAGLGGIWNGDAVPASRTTPVAALGTALLLILVAFGVRAVWAGDRADRDGLRIRRALLVLAGVAVVLPALAATGWGMAVMEWLVVHVPGAGLLRDTQKYVALAVPAYALCAAAGCRAIAEMSSGRVDSASDRRSTSAGATTGSRPPRAATTTSRYTLTSAAFIAVLVVPLLDLAWGVGGALRPVHYPIAWQRVAEKVDGPGDVAVLPGGMFRRFTYSGDAPVLDPAPRMLPGDVLQTGELPVRGVVVAGEGARARQVESTLLQGGSARKLADLGVGWVLVERDTPGPLGRSAETLATLEPVYEDARLALYRVPDAHDRDVESLGAQRTLAITAHALWLILLVGGLAVAAPAARETVSRRPERPVR
ncbi:hypothetical protein ACWEKT_03340 [Nocardia takedensis]